MSADCVRPVIGVSDSALVKWAYLSLEALVLSARRGALDPRPRADAC